MKSKRPSDTDLSGPPPKMSRSKSSCADQYFTEGELKGVLDKIRAAKEANVMNELFKGLQNKCIREEVRPAASEANESLRRICSQISPLALLTVPPG